MSPTAPGIRIPNEQDILFGRGNGVQNHPGNVSFREFVSGRKRDYIFAEKNEKTKISSSVYEEIKNQYPPVMFLEQDKNTLLWKEVEKKKAVSKIGQALRENAKEFKDKLDQVRNQTGSSFTS